MPVRLKTPLVTLEQQLHLRYYFAMPTSPSSELHDVLEEFLVRLFSAGESEGLDAVIDMDLTFSQARTLLMLAHASEPVPIHEVADRLRLSVAAAGRNVDQMVKLDLVERRENPADRRVKLVSLSEAGDKIAHQHFDAKRDELKRFAQRLTPEHCQRLTDALVPILAGDFLQPTTTLENCL